MTPAPPELVAKTIASFAAIPGWLWTVLALSGTIIRYAPVPDFVHFQHDQGWWLLSATVFCWLVVVVKLWQATWQLIRNALKKRSHKRAVLDHLHSLSPDEQAVIVGSLVAIPYTIPTFVWDEISGPDDPDAHPSSITSIVGNPNGSSSNRSSSL